MARTELVEIIFPPELQAYFAKAYSDRRDLELPNTYLSPGQLGPDNPLSRRNNPFFRFDIDIRTDEYNLPYIPTQSYFNQLNSRYQYTDRREFQPTFYYDQRDPIDGLTALYGAGKSRAIRSNYYTNYISLFLETIMERFYEAEGYEKWLATLPAQKPTIGIPVATPLDPNYIPKITDRPVQVSQDYYEEVITKGYRYNLRRGSYLTFGFPGNIGSFTFADNTLNSFDPRTIRRIRNTSSRNYFKQTVGSLEVFGTYAPYYEYIQRVKYTPDGTPFFEDEEEEAIDFFDAQGNELDAEALAEEQGISVEELIERANQDADNTNDIEERINEEAEIANLTTSVIFNNKRKIYNNNRAGFTKINGAMSGYITNRDLRVIADLDREEFRASLAVYRPLLGYEILASASNIPGISPNDMNVLRVNPNSLKKDPNLTMKPSYNSWYGYNEF